MMTPKTFANDFANAAIPSETFALELAGVSKFFGSRKALEDVSFTLPQGAFLSIFGPNGAGKTTLLRLIATLSRPTSGSISINGVDVKEHPEEAREHLGLVSHNSMLYGDLTPEENLELLGRLYGVKDPKARALELLEAVGLKHRRKDPVKTFSRGMTQRVSIARALMNDPALILLDEPYAGLDPHGVEALDELIKSMRKDRTFVMVSHNFEKGFSMATHALLLAKGRVVAFEEKDSTGAECDAFRSLYQSAVGKGVA